MVILSAFLLNGAAVAKETNLLGFAGIAKDAKMICPGCGVALTTDERIEKYGQENFEGGFK